MLSIEQKNYFLNVIIALHQTLDALKTENTLQELERFENQLTFKELEEYFLKGLNTLTNMLIIQPNCMDKVVKYSL